MKKNFVIPLAETFDRDALTTKPTWGEFWKAVRRATIVAGVGALFCALGMYYHVVFNGTYLGFTVAGVLWGSALVGIVKAVCTAREAAQKASKENRNQFYYQIVEPAVTAFPEFTDWTYADLINITHLGHSEGTSEMGNYSATLNPNDITITFDSALSMTKH